MSLSLVLAGCADVAPDAGEASSIEDVATAGQALICKAFYRPKVGVADTTLTSDPTDPTRANLNHGGTPTLVTGTVGTTSRETLLHFDLSSIPIGSAVQSATLDLRKAHSAGLAVMTAHDVLAPWTEGLVTHASFGGAFSPAAIASVDVAAVTIGAHVSLDLTAEAQGWVSGAPNHGVLLAIGGGGRATFGASETGVAGSRPTLSMCFTLPPPTCADALQNQGETGVDCGGPCAPCDPCAGVVCAALDQCHDAGTCDPQSGLCSTPASPDGTSCDDGDPETGHDVCEAGACGGTAEICNGLDDDQDGAVDEGDPGGGAACGTGEAGVCASGTVHCAAGALVCAADQAPGLEVPDGLDNDCDGYTDEGTFAFTYSSSQALGYAVAATSDGGFVLAGEATGGAHDVWIAKFDGAGAHLWEHRYAGGAADDTANDILEAANGDLVVAGYTKSGSPSSSKDIWMARLDPTGQPLWQKAYGGSGSGSEAAETIIETSDGDIVAVGMTNSQAATGALYDVAAAGFFLRVGGATGDVVLAEGLAWSANYNDSGRKNTAATSVIETSDGGFVVVGSTSLPDSFWVTKMDAQAQVQWMARYPYNQHVTAYDVVEAPDGDLVVVGATADVVGNDADLWALKLAAADGALLWANKIDGVSYSKNVRARATDDGFVLATTYAPTGTSASTDVWLVKLDENGQVGAGYPGTWQRTYAGTTGYDFASPLGGGYLLAARGPTYPNPGLSYSYVVKTDEVGGCACSTPFIVDTAFTSVPGPTSFTTCAPTGCHEWYRGLPLLVRDTTLTATVTSGTQTMCP